MTGIVSTLSAIDMSQCYWNPGCAMECHNPALSPAILALLNQHFGPVQLHSICCQHDPQLPPGSTIINNCAGCDRRFRSEYPGIQTISLWEVLDSIPDLPLPDHSGLTVSVHDSCSYRERPAEQQALRSILSKMHIQIIESPFSGAKAVCCGDSAYGKVSMETLYDLQRKRANQMPCDLVAVQCVTCIKSMAIGGKTPCYVPELLCNCQTTPGDLDMVAYHQALQVYIDNH